MALDPRIRTVLRLPPRRWGDLLVAAVVAMRVERALQRGGIERAARIGRVRVGMTGSGKTGLCLGLLEEAAIDQIPVIAIDPKGDVGNLLLTFPTLNGADLVPWIDPSAAEREGLSTEAFAEREAQRMREGLTRFGQDPSRIQRLRDSVEMVIYTPGSQTGRAL